MLQSALLNKYSEIEHFFFDKEDMLDSTKFAGLRSMVYTPDQIHSDKVRYIKRLSDKKHQADALITDQKIFLGVCTADCLPILLFDTRNKTIAAVHAGWRGLLNGIILNTIEYMRRMGSDKKRIIVAVGPHIRKCCYEISEELANKFYKKYKYLNPPTRNSSKSDLVDAETFSASAKSDLASAGFSSDEAYLKIPRPLGRGSFNKNARSKIKHTTHAYFSLTGVALSQLKYASIPSENIDPLNICTSCNMKYYSYRRDHNKNDRMLSTIGLIS